jgi:hypothetical protein
MSFLYVNSQGNPHRKHSYSSGLIFEQSPLKYYLQKILGWREIRSYARFEFGKAIEESIQSYHDHGGEIDIKEDFIRRWSAHKDNESITYTDTEKNWATCLTMGQDMVRLYAAVQPNLPIPMGGRAVWQREYSKTVFPGDPNYGEIDFAGKLDIVCYTEPDHPMLPKIEWKSEYGMYRPVIVDIKTSAIDFPEQPGMAALDAQLRVYSWLTGIRDTALLWFKKSGLGYKKGYSATVIEPIGQYTAGQEVVIAKVDGEDAWVVYNDFMVEEMNKAQGKKGDKLDQTDEAKQRAQNWLDQYGVRVPLSSLTRQRLQFNSGRVTQQSADDAGRIAGRQIIQIVNAWKNKEWPNNFGIRYPHDDRNDSYFRAFVLGDEVYKKQNFIKADEETFDSLFQEDEP